MHAQHAAVDPGRAGSACSGSIYPAIWSFQLALRTRGLASSLCSYHVVDHEEDVAKLLGIPEGFTQIGLIAVAYSKQAEFSPGGPGGGGGDTFFDAWGGSASLG